ncbi:MAG: T9SS type A sorting domain-containing protein [Prevotella sp.]|jgi:hypothetical protein|nr:T9SS type A sorting domain-containing protein [Prevotella sp.]
MHADLSTSSSRYWFGNAITVTAEIENHGPDSFSGEVGAAVFDAQGYFIDFLSKTTISELQPNDYATRTFTHNGGVPFIPGNYIVAVYYRTNNNIVWTIVPNDYGIILDEINYAEFEVYYSSNIETNSAFTITGGTLQQTQTATVNVDIKNTGSSTFYGMFRISLANIEDGLPVQNIQVLTATNGLPTNYHYPNGCNFTGTITASPGTYLMSLSFQREGETTWYYAGSSNFKNPVYVIVEASPIHPNMYETNDTQAQAYNLNPSFSDSNVGINTDGSNFHLGNDIDYYKIVLPSGYDYTVTPRLHDEYNSGNGQSYTVDALFSCSLNNTNLWSETYDDVMINPVSVENGGTMYFKVAPYFSGNTGTYLLDVQITRRIHAECVKQFTENFTNLNANTNTVYGDGSFVGNGNITWNYTHCLDASGSAGYPIDGKSLLLRRTAEGSKLISGTISNGIKRFSCKFRKAYTGTSQRHLELYINGELKGKSQIIGGSSGDDATIYDFSVEDINVSGNFTMEIRLASPVTTNAQIVIDDIEWCSTNANSLPEIKANNQIKVYPNPAKDYLQIQSAEQIEKVEIYNYAGELVIVSSDFDGKIDISGLPNGVYIARIYTNNTIATRKIIVKK